ncbi:hypothetical protein H072_6043 [Dactylellina haptotyla CBS 200.50]|uniref:F-box domain-containing protein n=1 Tax=Dactylellina haptotyla (strain CBS 200.50) TaxID=1284197 RepID=S8AB69_DACHA|nr:hypothetical protein H072_6043 [Dactylellina haptotyla CBS 200.50]
MSTLDYLPSEVLITILQNLDVNALRTLVKIYRRSRIIFADYHSQIITHILRSTLSDPLFIAYFPRSFDGQPYPHSTNLPPLETSHTDAFTHLRYARSIISLSNSFTALTAQISSILFPILVPKYLPRGSLGRAYYWSVENALTSTIHRCLVINAQTGFYCPLPFPQTIPFANPPRPILPAYLTTFPRNLLPAADLKDLKEEDILRDLSIRTPKAATPLLKKTYRLLHREIHRELTLYLRRHKIWRENTLLPSWSYVQDSASVRDEWFFMMYAHPDLLIQILRQCTVEDNYETFKRENNHRIEKWEEKQRKASMKLSIKIGETYARVAAIAHEFLEGRRRRGEDARAMPVQAETEHELATLTTTVPNTNDYDSYGDVNDHDVYIVPLANISLMGP